jgi:plastocyanin
MQNQSKKDISTKKKSILKQLIISGLLVTFILASCGSKSNPANANGKEFDSGSVATGGHFTHVFTTAKIIPYYCIYHGGPGGVGMSGVITVQAGGTASQDTVIMNDMTFTPPLQTIDVGDTIIWINRSTFDHTATSDK